MIKRLACCLFFLLQSLDHKKTRLPKFPKLQKLSTPPRPLPPDPRLHPHLYVSAAGHLGEVLLLLQRFVDLVVGHAEAAQPGLDGVVGLGKNDKLGHVWNTNDLSVHLSREVDRLLDLPAVY